jgi:hypothetical protein
MRLLFFVSFSFVKLFFVDLTAGIYIINIQIIFYLIKMNCNAIYSNSKAMGSRKHIYQDFCKTEWVGLF